MFSCPKRVAARLIALLLPLGLGLSGCAGSQLAQWQLRSAAAADRAVAAYLNGERKAFEQAFSESIFQAQRSARYHEVAKVQLLQCALHVAVLNFGPCPDSEPHGQAMVETLSDPSEQALQAYQQHLRGLPLNANQIALLPAAQRSVASAVSAAMAARALNVSDRAAGSAQAGQLRAEPQTQTQPQIERVLDGIQDPFSKLVAAGVVVRAGLGSPAVIAAAVDAASGRGWRAPLSAWLAAQARVAGQSGDRLLEAQAQKRLDLLHRSIGPKTQ